MGFEQILFLFAETEKWFIVLTVVENDKMLREIILLVVTEVNTF